MSTFKKYMEIIQEGETKGKEIELNSIEKEKEDTINKIRNMRNGDVIYVKNDKNERIFAISKYMTSYSILNVNLTNSDFVTNYGGDPLKDLLKRIKEIEKKPLNFKFPPTITGREAKKDMVMMDFPVQDEELEKKIIERNKRKKSK